MSYGGVPLIDAVQDCDDNAVLNLILEGADVDKLDKLFGCSALIKAAEKGHYTIAKTLLTHGAEVDRKSRKGCTALLIAAQKGQGEVVRLLLDHGAVIDVRDRYGRTALICAAEYEKHELMEFLLEGGADINAQDNRGNTALHFLAGKF